MDLKPLNSRLIVKPEAAATESATGIIFPETYGKPPAMSGTVIAVGRGPATAQRVRGATIAHILGLIEAVANRTPSSCVVAELTEEIGRYAMESISFSELAEGDYVAFAYTSGSKMKVDGDEYLVLNEDEVEAVWKPQESAA
jgi:co-chaperonin GroES (HSP10)